VIARGTVRLAALLAAAAGCDVAAFDRYRRESPVIVFERPGSYSHLSFGGAVAVASEAHRDWLVVSGGLGTAVLAVPVRDGTRLAPLEAPRYVCGPDAPCDLEARTGTALAGLERWQGASACALTGSFDATLHQVHGRCFGSDPVTSFTLTPPPGLETSGFGLALATPRRGRASAPSAGEIVFVGAPAEAGHVFAAMPTGLLDVTPAGRSPTAALGTALAAGWHRGTAGETDFLLAAGAPGMRAVFLLRGEPRANRPLQSVACIVRGEEPGFGSALALGDLDGDGRDDLIVSARGDIPDRRSRVHVYLASSLPEEPACAPNAWPAAAVIECTDVPSRGVHCGEGDTGFGSALGAGDLDGDGRDELLIAAPGARVADMDEAGAVWIVRAQQGAFATAGALRTASPQSGARLGEALAVASLGGRDEVFAGASGARQVSLFLCSGLEGDRPGEAGLDAQCRPQ
jgi:hypothetical protein